MAHYTYLIIGGGMTADAAVRGIREIDQTGSIGILSSDSDPPYDRPPLTKGLWKDKTLDSIWRHTENTGADLKLSVTVAALDAKAKTVSDSSGQGYSFDKLLLATGGTPRRFDFADDPIIYYRKVADYRRLRALCDRGRRFAVIGAGFIGSELAAALSMNQKEVTLIFPGKSICERIFPADLSEHLNDFYGQKGVTLWNNETVVGVAAQGGQVVVRTANRELPVDGVVAGLGIKPNVSLAQAAGLETADGIIVDARLRTSHPDIFAAGDVAAFHNPALNQRIRVEHEDNANTMGKAAGRNMAGKDEPYTHLPFFYSDLFELGYEAVGELDSRLKITAEWKEKYREGIVYYERDSRVRGVLLWNVWGKVDAARDLIASGKSARNGGLS